MTSYVRLEVLRTLRDPLYACLAIGAPIGFYLLFSGLFGSSPHPPGTLAENVVLMVAMAVFGGMWACFLATAPRIATERSSGWLSNLRLLPISPRVVLAGRAIAATLFALPAIVLVCGVAVLAHGVQLSAGQWGGVIALSWVGVWPFAILGAAIGYAVPAESAFGVVFGLHTALAALGGLEVPLLLFPDRMQAIGKLLPSYDAANLGWRLANGQAVDPRDALLLATWALLFLAFAAFYASRGNARAR